MWYNYPNFVKKNQKKVYKNATLHKKRNAEIFS